MEIRRLSCPSCHGNSFEHDADGNLICAFCGTLYASPRAELACPTCGTDNPAEARVCMNCGRKLGKICSACYHQNPAGADHCLECGLPLDTLSNIFERERQSERAAILRADRLVQSKQHDMLYMRQERERMDAQERARREQVREQQLAAQKQQKAILFAGMGLLLLCLLGTGIVLLVIS